MPNYFRQQSPWLDAAQGMERGADRLSQIMMQVPQVRAQMQRHADEMGLRQGGLELQQQEHLAKVPVYNAQVANYQAGAAKDNAGAEQLKMLMELAKTAQQAKFAERGGMQLGNGQGPTVGNAENAGTAQLLAALAAASTLAPDSAQRALAAEQAPVKLNMGETAFDPRTMNPLAQGLVSAPFGNMVQQGMTLPGSPTVQQQGQFRPSGGGQIAPSSDAKNMLEVLTQIHNLGSRAQSDPQSAAVISNALRLIGGGGSGNAQTNTSVPPAAQRIAGQVYQTPKGQLKWTGTGWVTP